MRPNNIPDTFVPLINEMATYIETTFPTFSTLATPWTSTISDSDKQMLFDFFFMTLRRTYNFILLRNAGIFAATSKINTNYLPNIDFKTIFNDQNTTEEMKTQLWKYLNQFVKIVLVNK